MTALTATRNSLAPDRVEPKGRLSGMALALLLSAALHGAALVMVATWGLDAPRPLAQVAPVINVTLLRWTPMASEADLPEREISQPPLTNATAQTHQRSDTEMDAVAPSEAAISPPAEPSAEAAPRSIAPVVLSTNIRHLAQQVARMPSAPEPAADGRIRRIDAAAPETVTDAYYLDAWRRKVERIGQLNYPQEAREQRLYGTLRLLVSIEPDGALRDVRLLASSGHNVLDEAAMRIVRLAAPFAPFPPALQDLDLLEIDRTWRFQRTRNAQAATNGARRRRTNDRAKRQPIRAGTPP